MYSTETELTNDILKLQSDILGEVISEDHPYLKKSKIASKNKQLETSKKFIIGAINELNINQGSLNRSVNESLATVYSVLGQISENQELKDQVLAKAPSLIDLVLQMNDTIEEIKNNPSQEEIDIAEELRKAGIIKYSYNEEIINVNDDSKTFKLSKDNIDFSSLKFFVNGIYYPQDNNIYTIDESNNEITWALDDPENGGFSLKDSQVIISYNYEIETEEEQNNG